MSSHRLIAPSLLLLALAGGVAAADPATAAGTASSAPAVDTTAISAEQLLKKLPGSDRLAIKDERVVWSDGKGGELRFAPVDPGMGNPLVETAIGNLAIERRLVAENRTEVIPQVAPLVAAAKAGGVVAEGLCLREGILTGIHLRSDQLLVLPEGVLKRAEAAAADRAAEREAVNAGVLAVVGELGESKLDELGRKTVEDVLRRLPNQDGNQEGDEVHPSFARRLVRHGWLATVLPERPSVARLVAAVVAADRAQPVAAFTGKGLSLAEHKDAFGRGGWILTTPTRTAFVRQHPVPLYHWAWEAAKMNVVVDLEPGSDPLAGRLKPVAARMVEGNRTLARWSRTEGFTADQDAWRQSVPAGRRKGVDPNAVAEFLPPHIVVAGLDGDVAGLIVPRGFLAAPAGADSAEGERFLSDAARLLRGDEARGVPDAAYLDLVGEHLLTYVYDSPDSRFPLLVGNKQNKGDIHQTALQTVATAAGGIMRGDCDDLAEVYQVLAERQGRTSIVIQLPGHAACAWADKARDGRWHAFVLQTGPALEFSDKELPDALRKAYLSFDKNMPFDPNGIGLLLRFSGENQRGSWRLSWRIFAEPDYCRTMIDVQRDWQYQTYQRGISKMLKLVAGGDTDTANYREIAGLYTFTGQHDLAADYHRKALAQTREPESRFLLEVELLGNLFEAGRTDEALKLADELIDRRVGEVRERMGQGLMQAGIQLAGVLAGHKQPERALRALEATALEQSAKQIALACAFIGSPRFDENQWDNHPQWQSLRHLSMTFALTVTGLLQEGGAPLLASSDAMRIAARATQDWQSSVAFRDVDEPGEAPSRYAMVARWYVGLLGQERVDQLVEQAPAPTAREHDHRKRVGGLAQLPIDASWLKVSVPWWHGRLAEQFRKEAKTIDPAKVAMLVKRVEQAYQDGIKLGMDHPTLEDERHFAQLLGALVGRDEKLLRERLRWVKDKDDKRIRDDTAQWIGDAARFLPVEWFTKVMRIWQEELDYKPKWFWIAWRARIGGADQQALIAAKMAADHFADDPSFKEEYDFMRGLIEPVRPSATPAAAK
jgi:tetratricopeptide (TPR) repeat protein